MIGFDVQVNGESVCLAAIGEKGILSAMVTWVVPSGPQAPSPDERLTLHVGGGAGPRTYTWIPFQKLNVGDVVQVKIVEVDSSDEAIKHAQVDTAPEGTTGWFDEARAKYRKKS
jgi:hypothetical protein